jgi:hypothetical protein
LTGWTLDYEGFDARQEGLREVHEFRIESQGA